METKAATRHGVLLACLATAEKFVERGGKVAILDLERSDGAAVAERLGGHFFPCNVMDYAAMEADIGEAVAALGSVQFCVNTAGGGVAKRTIAKDGSMHPLEDFQRIIDLNLIASFNVNRVVAATWRTTSRMKWVNAAS